MNLTQELYSDNGKENGNHHVTIGFIYIYTHIWASAKLGSWKRQSKVMYYKGIL